MAAKVAGRGVVAQVNTQDNPQLAARFNIRGIPTVVLFMNGKEADRVSGAMKFDELLAWWRRHMDIK